jgi:hypothetical protein
MLFFRQSPPVPVLTDKTVVAITALLSFWVGSLECRYDLCAALFLNFYLDWTRVIRGIFRYDVIYG